MIIGNPETFAIESEITLAYERLSLRALGFFVIHIMGRCYGLKEPDATMLATAFDGVGERIARRGRHNSPFIPDADAEQIAVVFSHENYLGGKKDELFFGTRWSQFNEALRSNGCVWAPDGEEGFDDGSRVLQFDVNNMARLVAFTSTPDYQVDPDSLRDLWLSQEGFYETLKNWRDQFEAQWKTLQKVPTT